MMQLKYYASDCSVSHNVYAAAIDKVWRRQIAEVAIKLAGWSPFFVSLGKAEIDKVLCVIVHTSVCVCVCACEKETDIFHTLSNNWRS